MLNMLKRNRIFWELFRLTSRVFGVYQPPWGSIGHAIQSGRITIDEAKEYLAREDDYGDDTYS